LVTVVTCSARAVGRRGDQLACAPVLVGTEVRRFLAERPARSRAEVDIRVATFGRLVINCAATSAGGRIEIDAEARAKCSR
jgi:hypothetical protein